MRALNIQPGAAYGFTLAQRIRAARQTGLIDEDDFRAAGRVNGTATEAAHHDPEVVADAFGVVRDALRLVQKLSPSI
jgi:hypothetical protein